MRQKRFRGQPLIVFLTLMLVAVLSLVTVRPAEAAKSVSVTFDTTKVSKVTIANATATTSTDYTTSPATLSTGNSDTGITVTIVPIAGGCIPVVKLDNVSKGAVSSVTFNMGNSSHNVTLVYGVSYIMTGAASPAGGGTVTPATQSVCSDGNGFMTYSISTAPSYRFIDITDNGVSKLASSSYTVFSIVANHAVVANFARQYTVTATAGTGGTITAGGTYDAGQTPVFTITPSTSGATKYVIDYVAITDGVTTTNLGAVATYPFPALAANWTIAAFFKEQSKYTLTTQVATYFPGPPAGYQLDGTGGTISPTNPAVYVGDSVSIAASPTAGYAFRGAFLGGCNGTDQGATNPFVHTPLGNETICFRFRPQDHTITATAHPNGSITPSGAVPVSQYETVTFNIAPNPGYDNDYVTVSPAHPLLTSAINKGAVASYTFSLPTANYAIDAFFKAHNYTITATAGANGSITPTGVVAPVTTAGTVTSVPYTYAGTVHYVITPAAGYLVQNVIVDGVNKGVIPAYDFIFSGSSNLIDHTITASFMPRVQYRLSVDCGTNGTITPTCSLPSVDPNACTNVPPYALVDAGTGQTFTITGNAGYNVLDVQIDGVSYGSINSYPFANVQAPHTIKATFIASWNITASAGANGIITPSGTVKVNNGANKTFTISPNLGYSVAAVVVDGASVVTTTSYTFASVTADHTISATFVYSGSELKNYCDNPPFISASARPNLLLMLDNSASMYDQAYTNPASYCYDDTYNDTAPYLGYFAQADFYRYDSVNNKFVGGATLPASCSFLTAFACVNMTAAVPRTVDNFVASGKFLNWLSASKLDVEKKVLTGGKFDSANDILIGETRGCVGRRFVRAVSGMEGITFTARGPYSYQSDFANQSTQGGQTRIEIYDKVYDNGACLKAVTDWQTGVNQGTTQNDTQACLGTSVDNPLGNSIYNHIIHTCYKQDYNGEMNSIQRECVAIWATAGHAANQIINPQQSDALCSSVVRHPLYNNNGQPNDTGFLGKCYNGSSWDDTCGMTEMLDFCSGIRLNAATDPSGGVYVAGTTVGVPSFIMDAGVTGLGPVAATFLAHVAKATPPTGVVHEFQNSITFGLMRFNYNGSGAECNPGGIAGSSIDCAKSCSVDPTKECYLDSDCSSGTCDPIPRLDGGMVKYYLGSGHCTATTATQCILDSQCPSGESCKNDGIGNHDGGLIRQIDDIQATSWTPFAEAFYNAMGYMSSPMKCSITTAQSCIVNTDCPGAEVCRVIGTSRTDFRLQAADFDAAKYPSTSKCQKNNILIVSDGVPTADRNAAVESFVDLYKGVSGLDLAGAPATAQTSYDTTNLCPPNAGSRSLDDLAWIAKHRNINTVKKVAPISTDLPQVGRDSISTHVVFNGTSTGAPGQCDPETLMHQTAVSGGGTYQQATDPAQLEDRLRRAFQGIAVDASSGTAASILSNSEGSGANILQAVFYPRKTFDGGVTNVDWIGEMQNLWYYVDPFIGNSTVREDSDYTVTNLANNDPHVFNLKTDKVAEFRSVGGSTIVRLSQDLDGNGSGDTTPVVVEPEDVKSLWRAGKQLWARTTARTIHTQIANALTSFTALDTSIASNRTLLQATDAAEAVRIINYVKGVDDTAYRVRNVTIGGVSNVWKLGDIVTSTPRVQSSIKLNSYDMDPPGGYQDGSYKAFISTSSYRNRGMAYVGANDGMLHAFKQGRLDVTARGDMKATLYGTNLGEEQWAFIPNNALPYLKYLTDKDYRHLYFVDGDTLLTDASIGTCGAGVNYRDCPKDDPGGTNWRTVLVGGMGLGGASRDKTGICNDTLATNCVKSPIAGGGYSSYFALDVTNQSFDPGTGVLAGQPSFKWEFSHPDLGYATSGPAIIKINARVDASNDNSAPDKTKNGRWFAVFASGATGPIDGNACQFKGKSDQNLKLFVVDLNATGAWALNTNYWIIDTGIANAFAGSIGNGVIDADRANRVGNGYYQDDALYIGYVKKRDAADTEWRGGGVLRLLTREKLSPADWVTSTVIDDIGPVTTNIGKLQDRRTGKHDLWLYFGSGRYFFNQDDSSSTRTLYAVKEPCYTSSNTIDGACAAPTSNPISISTLTNKTTSFTDILEAGKENGWYINLEAQNVPDAGFGAERVVTDPVAMTNGAVFFITFKPNSDPCEFGGKSYMWATKFDTGATPPAAALQGKALLQLSTGAFEEKNLADTFVDKDGRRSLAMTGKPPSAPPPIVSKANLKPFKRIIHIQEN